MNIRMTILAMILDATTPSFGGLSILTLVSGALLNAGGLAWWIRSGTDMKMAQRDATEAKDKAHEAATKSHVLESRINQQDIIISEIRSRMAKLDRVDEIVTSVKYIDLAVKQIEEAVSKNMVPRIEMERVWQSDDTRYALLEKGMRDLRNVLIKHHGGEQ
jgi:hypothetical protein